MIIHGINDSLVPYSYSEKAIEEAYTGEGSVLIPIYGKKSTHGTLKREETMRRQLDWNFWMCI